MLILGWNNTFWGWGGRGGCLFKAWGFINFFYLQGGRLNVYINMVPFCSPQKKMNSG